MAYGYCGMGYGYNVRSYIISNRLFGAWKAFTISIFIAGFIYLFFPSSEGDQSRVFLTLDNLKQRIVLR